MFNNGLRVSLMLKFIFLCFELTDTLEHLYLFIYLSIYLFIYFNWDSFHVRLNSHYGAWGYMKKEYKKLKHTGNLFRKNVQLKGVS